MLLYGFIVPTCSKIFLQSLLNSGQWFLTYIVAMKMLTSMKCWPKIVNVRAFLEHLHFHKYINSWVLLKLRMTVGWCTKLYAYIFFTWANHGNYAQTPISYHMEIKFSTALYQWAKRSNLWSIEKFNRDRNADGKRIRWLKDKKATYTLVRWIV